LQAQVGMQDFAKFYVAAAVFCRKSLFLSDILFLLMMPFGEEAIVCYVARQIPGLLLFEICIQMVNQQTPSY
jgi:hypothetical protein